MYLVFNVYYRTCRKWKNFAMFSVLVNALHNAFVIVAALYISTSSEDLRNCIVIIGAGPLICKIGSVWIL
jgi:hypothetical protein